jgi:hypothetical protein
MPVQCDDSTQYSTCTRLCSQEPGMNAATACPALSTEEMPLLENIPICLTTQIRACVAAGTAYALNANQCPKDMICVAAVVNADW